LDGFFSCIQEGEEGSIGGHGNDGMTMNAAAATITIRMMASGWQQWRGNGNEDGSFWQQCPNVASLQILRNPLSCDNGLLRTGEHNNGVNASSFK
jgi:hypothetical protein